jgi:hypothetical protein
VGSEEARKFAYVYWNSLRTDEYKVRGGVLNGWYLHTGRVDNMVVGDTDELRGVTTLKAVSDREW